MCLKERADTAEIPVIALTGKRDGDLKRWMNLMEVWPGGVKKKLEPPEGWADRRLFLVVSRDKGGRAGIRNRSLTARVRQAAGGADPSSHQKRGSYFFFFLAAFFAPPFLAAFFLATMRPP